jgi:hypothetical protein
MFHGYHKKKKKKNCSNKRKLFWLGMKKDVVDYIAICMECQRVKFKHRNLAGLLYLLPIP